MYKKRPSRKCFTFGVLMEMHSYSGLPQTRREQLQQSVSDAAFLFTSDRPEISMTRRLTREVSLYEALLILQFDCFS